MKRFDDLPLVHQPGERWLYNSGSNILGVLISRVAGTSLEEFLRERIFAPLGMNDTSFSVPASKLDRLASSYWSVNFWVEDTDAIAYRTVQLGAKAVVPPYDAPGFREAVLADPQGAVLSVSKLTAGV
jgi:CubicO group peptidase (beta-lactamase class C family)